MEILGVHGAVYYDYHPAVFQVATQFNQNPNSTFACETCRRTIMAQHYEYSSRKFFLAKKKKTEEQNTDFGVGGGRRESVFSQNQ